MSFQKIQILLFLLFLSYSLNSQTITVVSDGSYGTGFGSQNDTLVVNKIYSDSPAAKAGLLVGDRIVSIDGNQVSGTGKSFADMSVYWRDKAWVTKQLLIQRESVDTIFPVNIILGYDNMKSGEEVFWSYFIDTTSSLSSEDISSDSGGLVFKSIIDEGIKVNSLEPWHYDTPPDIRPGDKLLSFSSGYNSWVKLWFREFNDNDTIIRILRDSTILEIHTDLRDYPDLNIVSDFQNDLSKGEVWLRAILEGRLLEDKTIRLRIADTYDYAEVYQRSTDGQFRKKITGTSVPVAERQAFFKSSPVVDIIIRESSSDTIFLKITQESGFSYPPMIDYLSYDYVVWFESIERLILGSMLGMMLLIILYLLILYLFIRDRSYLAYLLFVVSLSFTLFHLSGYGDEFLWPDKIEFFQNIYAIFTVFPTLMFVVFGAMYLEVPESMPRIYRIGKPVFLISFPLAAAFWALEYLETSSILDITFGILAALDTFAILFLLVLILIALIVRLKQKFRPARYFLAGLTVLLISFIVFMSTSEISMFLVDKFNISIDVSTIILMTSIYLGAILQFLFLAVGLSQKMRDSQVEIRLAQEKLIAQLKENEKLKDKVNRELEAKVEERTKEITDSINYAKRIQTAVLPPDEMLDEILPEHFVLFKPRDIVSGDFYWVKQIKNFTIVVAADCTGHGVPGAFMSMLGVSFLNELVTRSRFDSAGELLNRLRKKVKETLKQEGKALEQKDGMDLALAIIDNESLEMQYSGAFNPIFIIRKGDKTEKNLEDNYRFFQGGRYTLIEIKGDRQPIAIHYAEKEFNTNYFRLMKEDSIYLFSDGYPDQMGGPEGKKFMAKKFKRLILDIQEQNMAKQKEILNETLEKWKGDLPQIDDIIVFGIRW